MSNHSSQIFTGLLICFIFSTAAGGMAGAIDKEKEKCKEHSILQYCDVDLPSISFIHTREELNKTCTSLKASMNCTEDYAQTCLEPEKRIFFKKMSGSVNDEVNKLCTRGPYQDEFLRHADCVYNIRAEVARCSDKYEAMLNDPQERDRYNTDQRDISTSQENIFRDVCCSFQELLSCSKETVLRTCGNDAALFVSNYQKSMASSIIRNFCYEYKGATDCGISDSASHPFQNLQLVFLGLSSLLALHLAGNLVPT